jgi:hypothetical protein
VRETVKAIPSSASGVSGFEVEVGVGVGDDVTSVSSVRWIISKNFFFFGTRACWRLEPKQTNTTQYSVTRIAVLLTFLTETPFQITTSTTDQLCVVTTSNSCLHLSK